MNYCSSCGRPMIRRLMANDGHARYVCTACGMIHYQNPRVIVGCAVCWCDKVLLCRRAQPPARGQWAIPSGFLECGETLEAGAARETFEETGVILDPNRLDLYSIVNMTAIEQIAVTFRVQLPQAPEIQPGAECLEVGFFAETEIPPDLLAWRESMGDRPQRFFNELRSGNFTIQLITIGSSQGTGFRSREYALRA
jgi:ADP-ribose pyrophosphatase YjhB (NUDIX family)